MLDSFPVTFRGAIFGLLIAGASSPIQATIQPEFLMDRDPEFQPPDRLKKFDPDLKRLWLEALRRPENDMQRMAAETIALGHLYGIPELNEVVPDLEKIVLAPTSHPAARFAAARALIALQAKGSVSALFQAAQEHESELRQLVEPVLAQWEYAPARAVWLKRLDTADTRPLDLLLAIRGLAAMKDQVALKALLKIANNLVRPPHVRIEAAQAAGQLLESGLETPARRLASESRSQAVMNRLCAIRLLQRHSNAGATELLGELANDSEPIVAAAALSRLNQIDHDLVLPFAESALASTDAQVREQAIIAYIARPTVERVNRLAQALGDHHPTVRRRACEGLVRMAENAEFRELTLLRAGEVLSGDKWQGQEQSALLLGALEHQPAGQRLAELLDSPRPEVMVAAAWALRKVAVPETTSAILDKIQRQTDSWTGQPSEGIDNQIAHLFEACAVLKATESQALLVQYIPKNKAKSEHARSAAIWALGLLKAGHPDPALGKALIARITDTEVRNPESSLVKQMCVVTLARTRSMDQARDLRDFMKGATPPTRLGLAMRWAIQELTGDVVPEPIPQVVDQGQWFLQPLR